MDVESFDGMRVVVGEVCVRTGAGREGMKAGSLEVVMSAWLDVFDVKKLEIAAL